jgi:hypothetical protein
MREAAQWWAEQNSGGGAGRPWLVLGDGPTLARRGEFDLSAYRTLALGPDVAREIPADAVLVRDADSLREAVGGGAQFVIAPHQLRDGRNGGDGDGPTLGALLNDLPPLKALAEQGRLVAYDHVALIVAGAGLVGGDSRRSDAAEAVWLLGALGAREVRTLGVDPVITDAGPTLESARQADAIAASINEFGLLAGPLTSEVPARIFIGSDPSQALGAKMLEYTTRRHSTLSTLFDTMQHVEVPMPKDPRNQPRTQFSFNRFAIPSLAGYRGRGLYVDADMQVFHDLRELWEMPFTGGAKAMYAPPSHPSRPPQTSVMLLDCANLKWDVKDIVRDLDEGRYDYEGLMRDMKLEPEGAVQSLLPPVWNSLEEYVPGKTRLLHYTDMKTQPWVSRRNPNGDLWVEALRDAIREGFVSTDEVRQAVSDGYVRPSLLAELKLEPAQRPLFRKVVGPLLDSRYKPHRQLRKRLSGAGIGISG